MTRARMTPTILWTVLASVGCAAPPNRGGDARVALASSDERPTQPASAAGAARDGAPSLPVSEASPAPSASPSEQSAPPTTASAPAPPPEPVQATPIAPSTSKCLRYEPEQVVLRGVIQRVTFPGPPNYESIANGDARETSWLLKLDHAACVEATENDAIDVAYSGIRRVQLVLEGDEYEQQKNLVGRRVEAVGTLFGQHTGHHHTEVLLEVVELRAASRPPK